MDWTEQGIVLSARKHGENAAIVTLLTEPHGCHAGLVRGGSGKRLRGVLQPGNIVVAHWRGRLAEHLGSYTCELASGERVGGGATASQFFDDPLRLAALSSACAITEQSLPEREAHPPIYHGLMVLLDNLDAQDWASAYVKWEMGLLGELGFGMDLQNCAATGSLKNLNYVSPKSGRAVCEEAAEPYRHLLLPLPEFLKTPGACGDKEEILQGLALTGYFLEHHVLVQRSHQSLPTARRRLIEKLS